MTPKRRPPRRRDILAGSLALATLGGSRLRAAPAPPPPPPPSPPPPPPPFGAVEVDVHCHSFCSADLPIVGFVAHYIPGLTDLSRELTRWPEMVVREIVGIVAKLPNAATPTALAEGATLQAALSANRIINPVPMLPDETVNALLGKVLVLVPFLISSSLRETLARYVSTLYIAAHARAGIAATMVDTYPSVSLFTPCLVDYDEWSEDRAPTELCDQIAIQTLICKLSIRGRIGRPGARIHPFVAFDPRREVVRRLADPKDTATYRPFGDARVFDPGQPYAPVVTPPPAINRESGALEMVRAAVESGGFLGVKVYPPVGFAPLDNAVLRPRGELSPRIDLALRALYAYCEAEEIPITAHTSAGNEYGIGFRTLVSPDRWLPVMKLYPNLRLNLGHFGHDYGIDRVRGVNAAEAWIRQASSLIQSYPNVYADLSNSPLVFDPAYALRYVPYLKEIVARFPKVKRRLMYGSDWWLNRLQAGSEVFASSMRSILTNARVAGFESPRLFGDDELADIMGRNALRFLGFLDENNQLRAGRAARRLRAFYAGMKAAPPAWLA